MNCINSILQKLLIPTSHLQTKKLKTTCLGYSRVTWIVLIGLPLFTLSLLVIASLEYHLRYSELETLLKEGKWLAANAETSLILEDLVDRYNREDLVDRYNRNIVIRDSVYPYLELLPCRDLVKVDQLWTKYSNGQYGFSIQIRNMETKRQIVLWQTGEYPVAGNGMFRMSNSGSLYGSFEYVKRCINLPK